VLVLVLVLVGQDLSVKISGGNYWGIIVLCASCFQSVCMGEVELIWL